MLYVVLGATWYLYYIEQKPVFPKQYKQEDSAPWFKDKNVQVPALIDDT